MSTVLRRDRPTEVKGGSREVALDSGFADTMNGFSDKLLELIIRRLRLLHSGEYGSPLPTFKRDPAASSRAGDSSI
jgi:hypothetical protein